MRLLFMKNNMNVLYDERNLIFSRARLKVDSHAYQEYYQKHPELKMIDDQIRELDITAKLRESTDFKRLFLPLTSENNTILKALHELVEDFQVKERVTIPKNFHQNIKEITKHYGAKDVGIVKLKKHHYYSHHGMQSTAIGKNLYGLKTDQSYTHAIVYIIPMNLDMINRSPHFETFLASQDSYLNLAYTGSKLALYLKNLGYSTVFQSEAYYLTPMVPLAYDAGLGEIGMANHLVHPKYGDAIRIGAVLTTLPLETSQPIDFGLKAFCKRCALCLMNCPSRSITHRTRDINGYQFYKFNDQTCFALWKNTGTDCGTCIQSCPFTQGIDRETQAWMKNDPKKIDQVIKKHLDTHTRRKYLKEPLPIVHLKKED